MDKEQYDMQIYNRIKDRPRAIHCNHHPKRFDHGFVDNLSHIAKKITNKAPKYHKEEVKIDKDGTYLSGMNGKQE